MNRRRPVAVIAAAICFGALTVAVDAAPCVNGKVTIVPSPLPSAAFHTFAGAPAGTKIYSYDLITVRSGKSSQDYLPVATFACDRNGIYVTANGARATYPVTATVFSHSYRTWAIFPGLAPTADEAAQLRLGRTRLVRLVTAAAAAAQANASPTPSPSASPIPKRKHFL